MRISGTGHRSIYFPKSKKWLYDVTELLRTQLELQKPEYIITGLALGWDTILAEESVALDIPIHCYIPFEDQGNNWNPFDKKIREELISRASYVKVFQKEYSKDCFFKRDRGMVDDCDKLFSLWNPEINSGGTFFTIKYAEQNNIDYENFWLDPTQYLDKE